MADPKQRKETKKRTGKRTVKSKRPFKIQTPGEKLDAQMTNFMSEVMQRIQMLEAWAFSLGNDLSLAVTAVKALKNLMQRKKIISAKQFDREFEKLFNQMVDLIKKTEEETAQQKPNVSQDEIMRLMNDPDIGHA